MNKSKICVVGHFDRSNAFDGQTIKTIEITDALSKRYSKEQVRELSYHAIKNKKLQLMSALLSAFFHSEKIVILATSTSVPSLLRVCTILNRFFKREMHFILIGGALPEGIDENPSYLPILKHLNAIYLETETLISELRERGLSELYLLPNFKTIRRFSIEELPKNYEKPYRLIYMSRVTEEKGVFEMIDQLKKINSDYVKYTLDIYGIINDNIRVQFDEERSRFPEYIKYCGIANAWETSEIMHTYFLHVLPTKCPTEGQPASVIDSFFAGVPVLVGRWNSCSDMVREGELGVSFELGNFDDFRHKLEYFYDNPDVLSPIRSACIAEAEKFMPDTAIKILFDNLD